MILILGNTLEIPFIYCKDNIIHKANESFIDLTGYSYEEIIGQSLKELISLLKIDSHNSVENSESKDDLCIYTKEKIRKHITISWENLINEHEKIYFFQMSKVANDKVSTLGIILDAFMTFRDTNHRFTTEELFVFEKSANNFSFSYATLSYPDFKILYINKKGYDNLKIYNPDLSSAASMIGNNLFKYYNLSKDEKDELMSNILNSIENEPFLYTEFFKFMHDEIERHLKVVFEPIFDINKKITKIITFGIDITEKEMAKKEMTRALKIQEEIFINASHELKTPVNLIFSAAQLCELYLKREPFSDSKNDIVHSTNIIMQNCYRLTKIINNILDVSKIESGYYDLNLSNENIVQVVEDIVEAVSDYIEKDNVKIIFDTDIEENVIACDLDKVQRIILSLISNAIKFSSPDGIIFINLISKDNFIEISVEDKGMGIHENDFKLIFDKFLQVDKSLSRSSEGTGFGLSLVKSFFELHGGTIDVESALGKGSIFKIKLPIVTVNQLNMSLGTNNGNILEKIKLEFSDIYSL